MDGWLGAAGWGARLSMSIHRTIAEHPNHTQRVGTLVRASASGVQANDNQLVISLNLPLMQSGATILPLPPLTGQLAALLHGQIFLVRHGPLLLLPAPFTGPAGLVEREQFVALHDELAQGRRDAQRRHRGIESPVLARLEVLEEHHQLCQPQIAVAVDYHRGQALYLIVVEHLLTVAEHGQVGELRDEPCHGGLVVAMGVEPCQGGGLHGHALRAVTA